MDLIQCFVATPAIFYLEYIPEDIVFRELLPKYICRQAAIYFENTRSGYDCCTTANNIILFAHIYINNAASSKNYLNNLSISCCVNVISKRIVFVLSIS